MSDAWYSQPIETDEKIIADLIVKRIGFALQEGAEFWADEIEQLSAEIIAAIKR